MVAHEKPSKTCPKNEKGELKKQGWVKQFVADEPRLSEAVELYKSLGYEVRLEPVDFDEVSEECRKCLLYQDCSRYRVIYIRPSSKGEAKGVELAET